MKYKYKWARIIIDETGSAVGVKFKYNKHQLAIRMFNRPKGHVFASNDQANLFLQSIDNTPINTDDLEDPLGILDRDDAPWLAEDGK
jgi:hypothetical protein